MKSDFVRGIVQDESIKETIAEDMSEVPNVFVDLDTEDYTVADVETEGMLWT